MTEHNSKQNAYYIIYLIRCLLNGRQPTEERLGRMDMHELYATAAAHSVSAVTAQALHKAGISDPNFDKARSMALYHSVLYGAERSAILEELERRGIWYLPLKGLELSALYPKEYLREMLDNDILIDPERRGEVREVMEELGFTAGKYGEIYHDTYSKPPVLCFEMHTRLFDEFAPGRLGSYYSTEKISRIVKGGGCRRRFSDEDFYIYITAHEWEHFTAGGAGLRALLDCYLFDRAKGDKLDREYISRELKKMGIGEFEHTRRSAAEKIFTPGRGKTLTPEERRLLDKYLAAVNTCGTYDERVKSDIEQSSRLRYILRQLFPPMGHIERSVGFVKKCHALYPVGVVYRWVRAVFFRRELLKVNVENLTEK
ncbi:MAG: nucleotidyltransferase family protein [Ruminococcus sp.]|nr:nucleotidyltransferase family protein [Ruminococcus sp.]